MLKQFLQRAEMPASLLTRALGVISLGCDGLITIPPSSILGAILWTGYVGDLVATHLRIV